MKLKASSWRGSQLMQRPDYEISHYRNKDFGTVEMHSHDFYELYFFLSGKATYIVEKGHYVLQSGDVLLIAPTNLHQLDVTESDQAYERIVLWLSPRYLKSLSTATTDLTLSFQITSESGNHLIRDNGVSSSLHTSLQSLLNLQERAGYGEDIEAQQLVQKVLLELGRYVQGNQEALKKPEVNSLVSEAITYIDAHLEEPLSLEELANKLYIGKYYLLHLFKKQTNTTPHQYILKKRLLLSKRYIEQGEPIREVYLKAGFSDYTHYFRAFKQEYGMTPKEYYYLATR